MGTITHTKVSLISDDPAAATAGEVLPSDWNDAHTFSLTKTDVGLDNVDNTSDANKPVSTATQTALDLKVDKNAAITAATKTKITYDAKGLVTAGTDATTADIADSTNKRYVTDAQLTVIGNTSGTNTGDETGARIATLTHAASAKSALVDADEVTGGDSAASFGLIRSTWANIKAFLKTYFDTLYAPIGGSVVRGYINGFGLSYSSTTVLGIAAGYAADSTNTVGITGTAFTKSTAGTWAAGTAGNGMGTGLTIANSTWYHVFAIINAGAFDVYFDTSVTAANAPASTTAFKRIGSFLTNGSAQIVQFYQLGQNVQWFTQFVDVNGAPPATATLVALTIPPGVRVMPLIAALHNDNSVGNSYTIWSADTGATKKNLLISSSQVSTAYDELGGQSVISNTSQQVYHATNGANSPNVFLYTLGWIDPSLAATV